MKVADDRQTDSLTITLGEAKIKESDFGYDGGAVRFEIMQASQVVENAREIQFGISEGANPNDRGLGGARRGTSRASAPTSSTGGNPW